MATVKIKAWSLLGAEILTFKEGKMWIACWSRFDVVAQGKTEKEACLRLERTIAFQAIGDAEIGNLKSFGSCKKPSQGLLRRWIREHKKCHPVS